MSIESRDIPVSSRPRTSPAAVTEVLDGEAVVFVEGTTELHVLNPTATLIWSCLDGKRTVREIALEFSEAAGVPYDLVLSDVQDAVRSFETMSLLAGSGSVDGVVEAPKAPDPGSEAVVGTDLRFLPEPPYG
jgi:hypothetical protein